jgi:AcrR family transcriptional regulator
MKRRQGRPAAGQEALTRARILEAALELVDARGPDGLSMRRLAGALGVDPMAIYHHLSGKRALLDALVAQVFGALEPPPAGASWQAQVRAFAWSYRRIARAHPALVLHLVSDSEAARTAALLANEPLYAALLETGLPPGLLVAAADLLIDFLHGVALAERGGPLDLPGVRLRLLEQLGAAPAERFPAQRRALASLSPDELDDSFDRGLEVILAGVAALAQGSGGEQVSG